MSAACEQTLPCGSTSTPNRQDAVVAIVHFLQTSRALDAIETAPTGTDRFQLATFLLTATDVNYTQNNPKNNNQKFISRSKKPHKK